MELNIHLDIAMLLFITATVWIIFVLLLRSGLSKLPGSQPTSQQQVSFNILVAARNEEDNIVDCIRACAEQDYPADLFRVFIINDNSTDKTLELAQEEAAKYPNVRIWKVPPPPPGVAPKKYALIKGIMESRHEVIITTDADCRPNRGWLKGMAAAFDEDTRAVVGYSPISGRGLVGAVSRFDTFVNGVVSAGSIGLGKPTTAVGRNFAYRREMFWEIGGFGNTLKGASGDDDLLLQRIAAVGHVVRFATDPATNVKATGHDSFGGWMRMKRRHYSAGKRYQPMFILISGLLYLLNLGLLVSLVGILTGSVDWRVPLYVFAAKSLADFLTLAKGAKLLKERGWQLQWLVGEIVSPLLITLLIPLSLVGRVKWKARSLES